MESTRTLDSVFETSHRNPAQSAPSNWVHSVHHSQVLHALLLYYEFGICTISDLSHDRYLIIFTMRNENRAGSGGKFKLFGKQGNYSEVHKPV